MWQGWGGGAEGVKYLLYSVSVTRLPLRCGADSHSCSPLSPLRAAAAGRDWHSPNRSCQQNLLGTTSGKAKPPSENLALTHRAELEKQHCQNTILTPCWCGLAWGVAWSKSSSGESLGQVCCCEQHPRIFPEELGEQSLMRNAESQAWQVRAWILPDTGAAVVPQMRYDECRFPGEARPSRICEQLSLLLMAVACAQKAKTPLWCLEIED